MSSIYLSTDFILMFHGDESIPIKYIISNFYSDKHSLIGVSLGMYTLLSSVCCYFWSNKESHLA